MTRRWGLMLLSRSILALAAVASLALPAAASAHRGPGHEGRFGATTFEDAAPAPTSDDQQPSDTTSDVPVVDAPATEDEQPTEETPRRKRGKAFAFGPFAHRVWRVGGEADGYDADRKALSVVVDEIAGLPRRQAKRLKAALAQLDVLVGPKTRVVDADGHRVTGDAIADALDNADAVTVTGKLAPRKAWTEDEDGELVPAMRALRIRIVDSAPGGAAEGSNADTGV
jgi:hypothetical protein